MAGLRVLALRDLAGIGPDRLRLLDPLDAGRMRAGRGLGGAAMPSRFITGIFERPGAPARHVGGAGRAGGGDVAERVGALVAEFCGIARRRRCRRNPSRGGSRAPCQAASAADPLVDEAAAARRIAEPVGWRTRSRPRPRRTPRRAHARGRAGGSGRPRRRCRQARSARRNGRSHPPRACARRRAPRPRGRARACRSPRRCRPRSAAPACTTVACGRCAVGSLDEIRRAAERAHHLLERLRGPPAHPAPRAPSRRRRRRVSARPPSVSISPASASTTPRAAGRAARRSRKATAFSTSTALPAAEASGSFMSVMSALVFSPAPFATATRLAASSRADSMSAMKAPEPRLHVEHQALQPGRELLGEDGGGDERHRLHRRRHVADRVEALVGGREIAGLADDGAACALRSPCASSATSGCVLIAGDRVELVERAAGMAEPAAGDHRHDAAAGGDDRRQHQRDVVADAAGRMLVEHRPVGLRPVEHVAGIAHGKRQRRRARPSPCRGRRPPSRRRRPALRSRCRRSGPRSRKAISSRESAPPSRFLRMISCGRKRHAQPTPPSARSAMSASSRARMRASFLPPCGATSFVSSCDSSLAGHARPVVGDDGEGEHPQPQEAGEDHLRHGRHADRVGAEDARGADLRRRLEARAGEPDVDALLQLHALVVGGRHRRACAAPDRRPSLMPTKRASLVSPISGLRLPKLMWSVISMTRAGRDVLRAGCRRRW